MSTEPLGPRTRTIRRKGGERAPAPSLGAPPTAAAAAPQAAEAPPPSDFSGAPAAALASAEPATEDVAQLVNERRQSTKAYNVGRMSDHRLDGKALLAELDALDDATMARLLGMGAPELPQQGERVKGTVVRVAPEVIFVDLGAKSEAWLERTELAPEEQPAVGELIEAFVVSADVNGIRLARKLAGAAAQDAVEDAHAAGLPV